MKAQSGFDKKSYDILCRMLEVLKVEFPEVGFSFGYVGNLERWGDDRNWYFFTEVQTRRGMSCSWGGYVTDNLGEMVKTARDEKRGLRAYARHLRSSLETGEVRKKL